LNPRFPLDKSTVYLLSSINLMKTKLDRGQITFGSSYQGLGIQLYWPEFSLERMPKSVTNREWGYPSGFCLRFGTSVRLVCNPIDKHYALAGKILGFGAGIQYIAPEPPRIGETPS
jgi:hypothetical protein